MQTYFGSTIEGGNTMNINLQDAVATFKELGWEFVTMENILDLPLGSKEQKRIALSGLKSGDWEEFAEISKNKYDWRSYVDVDKGNLALFAIRVGVDARRAIDICDQSNQEMLIEVVAERGPKYATKFIEYICQFSPRMREHSASVLGKVAVQLVHKLKLEIPQDVEYIRDWSVYAANAMGLKTELTRGETNLPDIDFIQARFNEHILTGATVNTPATGPFGLVIPAGVKRGWLSREVGEEITFSALDGCVRPSDRKVWLDVLEELEVSDEELYSRIQSLIPLLALGDTPLITQLAPRLIALADDELLGEVLLAAFSSKTKKAKQIVLKSALSRSCPDDAEILVPWLTVFANDTDKTIATLADKLMKQWGLEGEEVTEKNNQIQGFWQETPAIWEIPLFDLGEVSPEALTELAAKLVSRPTLVHDVITEQFLAVANAVAYDNPEAARTSLGGLRHGEELIENVRCWVKRETSRYGMDEGKKRIQPLLLARDYAVCLQLDELPCLLSTPSVVDLSIQFADLVERLALYDKTKTDVLEADLVLALSRLDLGTKTSEAVHTLNKLNVSIRTQAGEKMSVSAEQVVLAYLEDPVKEPLLITDDSNYWDSTHIIMPNSLKNFPNRFTRWYYEKLLTIFPLWGDVAFREVRWNREVYHEQGLILRQVARRRAPLPPGASINILAAQRSMTPDAAEDSMRAVTEAWERGLLRPKVADVAYLDWSAASPSNLSAFATALEGIAKEGMLGVVWPILDEVIQASIQAPRLLAGTAEFAQLILDFLPEVQFAITQGIADHTALSLSGVRALAEHGGSSRAVGVAQRIVSQLPSTPVILEKEDSSLLELNPPFEEIWPKHKKVSLPIDDGVKITVDWVDATAPTKLFLFTLTLLNISDRIFQIVVKWWYYDLENEGQRCAFAVSPDTTAFIGNEEDEVWLHWDTEQNKMVVCKHRNWFQGKDNSLHGVQPPPLPPSLLIIIIGLLAQDGDAIYFAPDLLRECIEKGEIDEQMIRKATQIFLQNPVVSPAKLVRVLEKDVKLLHVLWPMLTECTKFAGDLVVAGEAPPVWVNRILDISLRYAPYLIEAIKRGLIPPEDAKWSGLSEIASLKSKSAAVGKAKKLLEVLIPFK